MSNLESKIKPCLEDADALPFLFIGSGFTKRYLGLPTWIDLIKHIASITYEDEFGFAAAQNEANKHYNHKIEYNRYMTYLTDLISNDLDKIWYTDPKFLDSRNQYSKLVLNDGVSPIKIEVAKYINTFKVTNILPDLQNEFNELSKIAEKSIAGVITTNYDTLIESIFPFEVYSSQEELLFHTKYDLGEVYKIHGSVTSPQSILIDSKDYSEIETKHKYISAKLLTIFVEHPVFFIGYSLGDEDIRNILYDIQVGLSSSQLKQIEKRLFFVNWNNQIADPEVTTYTIDFERGNSLTIGQINISNYSQLYQIIGLSSTKYPVKLLRYAKRDLYQFTLTTRPSNKVVLSVPTEDMNPETLKNVEFVYGFGIIERAEKGYGSVTPDEIFRDVVFDDQKFVNEMLVKESIPIALRQSSGFLPIRKYIRDFNLDELPQIVQNNLERFSSYNSFLSEALKKQCQENPISFSEAIRNPNDAKLSLVKWNKDNISTLHEYLKRSLNPDPSKFKTTPSQRRLIRIFDYIKYKK